MSVIVAVVFITAISPPASPTLQLQSALDKNTGLYSDKVAPGAPVWGWGDRPSSCPILMGQPGPKLALVQGNARNLASVGYIVTDNKTQLSWTNIHITLSRMQAPVALTHCLGCRCQQHSLTYSIKIRLLFCAVLMLTLNFPLHPRSVPAIR